jgi:hypothetical protein
MGLKTLLRAIKAYRTVFIVCLWGTLLALATTFTALAQATAWDPNNPTQATDTSKYLTALSTTGLIIALIGLLPMGIYMMRHEKTDKWAGTDYPPVPYQGVVPSDTPLTGYKTAYLTQVGDTYLFEGIAHGRYEVSGKATCDRELKHPAPAEECRCGFYAFGNEKDAKRARETFQTGTLIEAEPWGRIIEHRLGWRAEEQTITKVTINKQCRTCLRKTTSLLRDGAGRLLPTCDHCARGQKTVNLIEVERKLGIPLILG